MVPFLTAALFIRRGSTGVWTTRTRAGLGEGRGACRGGRRRTARGRSRRTARGRSREGIVMMGWVRAVGAPPAALGGPAGSMGLSVRAAAPRRRCRGNRPPPRVASLCPGTALAGERERRLVGTPTRATMAAVILVPLRDTVHRPRPLSPTSGPRRRRPAGALAPREEWHPSSVATRLSSHGQRAARTRALPSTAETSHARPPPCSRAATAAAAPSTPSGPIRATVCG